MLSETACKLFQEIDFVNIFVCLQYTSVLLWGVGVLVNFVIMCQELVTLMEGELNEWVDHSDGYQHFYFMPSYSAGNVSGVRKWVTSC